VSDAPFCVKLLCTTECSYITGVMLPLFIVENDIFAQYILLVCSGGMSHHNLERMIYHVMMTKWDISLPIFSRLRVI